MATDDFFRARLDGMVDPRHPLVVLASRTVRVKVVVAPVMQPQPFCLGLAGMAC